jgi:hypothetical protein
MVTQGLGSIVNVGASIQGTEFLSYPGMNFNLMPDWAKTKEFLKSKWELTKCIKKNTESLPCAQARCSCNL